MPLPVYVVASNMIGQKLELDMIADNVANANTTGYKKQGMDFAELLSKQQAQEVASFNMNLGTTTNFNPGALTQTKNNLDVGLIGDGFFGVEGPNGQTLYTRDGHFNLDAEGSLVNARGQFVLDNNNAPITIPADSTFINITPNGAVSNQNGVIANLGVFEANNPQLMRRAGFGTWIAPEGVDIANVEVPTMKQGFLESSNVDPIQETVAMTDMLRRYQSAANLVNTLEDIESRAIESLASMPN